MLPLVEEQAVALFWWLLIKISSNNISFDRLFTIQKQVIFQFSNFYLYSFIYFTYSTPHIGNADCSEFDGVIMSASQSLRPVHILSFEGSCRVLRRHCKGTPGTWVMKCTVVLQGFCNDPESRRLWFKIPSINTYAALWLFLSDGVPSNAAAQSVHPWIKILHLGTEVEQIKLIILVLYSCSVWSSRS